MLLALVIGAPSVLSSDVTTTSATGATVGNMLRDYRGSIVIVKGKNATGSGFIVTRAGRQLFVSNIHVMAGIRSPTYLALDRSPLQFRPGSAVAAVGHDLFMMEVQGRTNGIPFVESFDSTVTVNDPIVVFGNSGSGGVITAIEGKVLGIGPDRVEISAEIEHGNSGSPIIHLPTGRVIGTATYVTSRETIAGEKKDRRFGYRMDTVKKWEAVDWTRFYAEADRLEQINDTTSELRKAFIEIYQITDRTNKFRVYAYESPVIRTALDGFYSALHRATDRRELNGAVNDLLGTLRGVSQTYPLPGKTGFSYDYFKSEFNQNKSERVEIMNMLSGSLQK